MRRKNKEADNKKVEIPSANERSQIEKQLLAFKKLRRCTSQASNQAEIKANKYCMCFGRYKKDTTGEDWLDCGCVRWLHEECMEDCICDTSGQNRICLICCMHGRIVVIVEILVLIFCEQVLVRTSNFFSQ